MNLINKSFKIYLFINVRVMIDGSLLILPLPGHPAVPKAGAAGVPAAVLRLPLDHTAPVTGVPSAR